MCFWPSGSLWWTGRPGVLWFMGSQWVGHDWATELNWTELNLVVGLPRWCSGKESACQCRKCKRCGSLPGLGRSPGVGNGNLLQQSCLENAMDRGAWWATDDGVTKNQTQQSTHPNVYWELPLTQKKPPSQIMAFLSKYAKFHSISCVGQFILSFWTNFPLCTNVYDSLIFILFWIMCFCKLP